MPAEGEVLLKARDLTVCYRTGEGRDFAAVVDASFEILPGEVVGMLGESGCGKTTVGLALLRLFSASGRITRGSVLFRGQDLLRHSLLTTRRVDSGVRPGPGSQGRCARGEKLPRRD